jgi:outer membrane protein OmpA-like peptidoglycan-associated protein
MMKKLVLVMLLCGLVLPSIGYAVPGFMLARMGTMDGQVFVDGKPAKEVLLTFFMADKGLPPISDGGMGRIPDSIDRADADGKFAVQLPEGSYYLGILFRPMDGRPGPPRKGERFYFGDDGQGKLRKLAIADFKKSEIGRIDCSVPSTFKEDEDHFTVQGVVLRGEGANEPLEEAMVLAKKSAEAMRPEYFSAATGKDGKFSIKLPPGQTFYLISRLGITGAKPNPGEDIGKLGVDKESGKSPEVNFSGAPAPPTDDFMSKAGTRGQVNDTAIPVTGKVGEVISGMEIHMFKMPDSQAIKEARQNAAGVGGQGMGANAGQGGIEFAENSIALSLGALAELDGWVKTLQENKESKIEIHGYAISTEISKPGKAKKGVDYPKKLSEQRAAAVKTYLQGKGVAAVRMKVVGHGAGSDPVAGGPAGKGRVEIAILHDK